MNCKIFKSRRNYNVEIIDAIITKIMVGLSWGKHRCSIKIYYLVISWIITISIRINCKIVSNIIGYSNFNIHSISGFYLQSKCIIFILCFIIVDERIFIIIPNIIDCCGNYSSTKSKSKAK